MDWNHSSFTLKDPTMPYMETTAMVQHSEADTTFTSPTLQAPTRILTATWVIRTSNWQGTDMALVTREACSQGVIISSLMKWKYFIRLTRNDITTLTYLACNWTEVLKMFLVQLNIYSIYSLNAEI